MKLIVILLVLVPPVAFPQVVLTMDSDHRSKLHPMQCDLASSCYLIQGLPEAVGGSDFFYSDSAKKRGEDQLIAILNASRGGAALKLKQALTFLASRIFVNNILVMTKEEGLRYIRLLKGATHTSRLNQSIALAMLFYFSSKFAPKEAATYLHKLSLIPGESSAIILRNVRGLAAHLIVTSKRPKNLDHPAAYR